MKLDDAADHLQEQTEALRAVPAEAQRAVEEAARQSASQVRVAASRAHHNVSVRVIVKHGGVRVTVQGPQAERYRRMVERDLETRLPGVKAQIRTMTGGRGR